MAVIVTNLAKQARQEGLLAALALGKLEIGTAGMAAVLATFTFPNPAGSVATDTINFTTPLVDADAAASGVAAAARIRNSSNQDMITGLTVGLTGSGADIELDNTNIAAGQQVTITGLSNQHYA